MAESEQLGFEHMGLDPRLLQVPRGLRIRARGRGPGEGRGGLRSGAGLAGGLCRAARRLSRLSSLLGRHRPGLVTAHADPGKGHPAGPGGEGPPGAGPHWLWEDGCLCHSDAAAAAPQEGGGSR